MIKTVCVFTLSLFLSSLSAEAAPVLSSPTTIQTTKIFVPPFAVTPKVSISNQQGSIQDVFVSSNNKKESSVTIIQDAHDSLDAQGNIRKILKQLVDEENVSLVLFEGGSQQFNQSYYDVTPSSELNKRIWDELFLNGEMSGLARFALEAPKEISFYGLEDEELYFKNINTIQRIYKSESETSKALAVVDQTLNSLKTKLVHGELKKFLDNKQRLDREQISLHVYAHTLSKLAKKKLNLDFSQVKNQTSWPQLVRLIHLKQLEVDVQKNNQQIEKEIKVLQQSEDLNSKFSFLFDPKKHYQAGGHLRWYFERLSNELKEGGIDIEQDFTGFMDWIGFYVLVDEMNSEQLFSEINKLENKLLEKQELTDEIKAYLALNADWQQAKKLIELKLTREGWLSIQQNSKSLSVAALLLRIKSLSLSVLGNGINFSKEQKSVIQDNYDIALTNYEWVVKRDDAFFKRISSFLGQNKKIAVITGGFHSEPLQRGLKQKDISYSVISPAIQDLNKKINYKEIMSLEKRSLDSLLSLSQTGLPEEAALSTYAVLPFQQREQAIIKALLARVPQEQLLAVVTALTPFQIESFMGSSLGEEEPLSNQIESIAGYVKTFGHSALDPLWATEDGKAKMFITDLDVFLYDLKNEGKDKEQIIQLVEKINVLARRLAVRVEQYGGNLDATKIKFIKRLLELLGDLSYSLRPFKLLMDEDDNHKSVIVKVGGEMVLIQSLNRSERFTGDYKVDAEKGLGIVSHHMSRWGYLLSRIYWVKPDSSKTGVTHVAVQDWWTQKDGLRLKLLIERTTEDSYAWQQKIYIENQSTRQSRILPLGFMPPYLDLEGNKVFDYYNGMRRTFTPELLIKEEDSPQLVRRMSGKSLGEELQVAEHSLIREFDYRDRRRFAFLTVLDNLLAKLDQGEYVNEDSIAAPALLKAIYEVNPELVGKVSWFDLFQDKEDDPDISSKINLLKEEIFSYRLNHPNLVKQEREAKKTKRAEITAGRRAVVVSILDGLLILVDERIAAILDMNSVDQARKELAQFEAMFTLKALTRTVRKQAPNLIRPGLSASITYDLTKEGIAGKHQLLNEKVAAASVSIDEKEALEKELRARRRAVLANILTDLLPKVDERIAGISDIEDVNQAREELTKVEELFSLAAITRAVREQDDSLDKSSLRLSLEYDLTRGWIASKYKALQGKIKRALESLEEKQKSVVEEFGTVVERRRTLLSRILIEMLQDEAVQMRTQVSLGALITEIEMRDPSFLYTVTESQLENDFRMDEGLKEKLDELRDKVRVIEEEEQRFVKAKKEDISQMRVAALAEILDEIEANNQGKAKNQWKTVSVFDLFEELRIRYRWARDGAVTIVDVRNDIDTERIQSDVISKRRQRSEIEIQTLAGQLVQLFNIQNSPQTAEYYLGLLRNSYAGHYEDLSMESFLHVIKTFPYLFEHPNYLYVRRQRANESLTEDVIKKRLTQLLNHQRLNPFSAWRVLINEGRFKHVPFRGVRPFFDLFENYDELAVHPKLIRVSRNQLMGQVMIWILKNAKRKLRVDDLHTTLKEVYGFTVTKEEVRSLVRSNTKIMKHKQFHQVSERRLWLIELISAAELEVFKPEMLRAKLLEVSKGGLKLKKRELRHDLGVISPLLSEENRKKVVVATDRKNVIEEAIRSLLRKAKQEKREISIRQLHHELRGSGYAMTEGSLRARLNRTPGIFQEFENLVYVPRRKKQERPRRRLADAIKVVDAEKLEVGAVEVSTEVQDVIFEILEMAKGLSLPIPAGVISAQLAAKHAINLSEEHVLAAIKADGRYRTGEGSFFGHEGLILKKGLMQRWRGIGGSVSAPQIASGASLGAQVGQMSPDAREELKAFISVVLETYEGPPLSIEGLSEEVRDLYENRLRQLGVLLVTIKRFIESEGLSNHPKLSVAPAFVFSKKEIARRDIENEILNNTLAPISPYTLWQRLTEVRGYKAISFLQVAVDIDRFELIGSHNNLLQGTALEDVKPTDEQRVQLIKEIIKEATGSISVEDVVRRVQRAPGFQSVGEEYIVYDLEIIKSDKLIRPKKRSIVKKLQGGVRRVLGKVFIKGDQVEPTYQNIFMELLRDPRFKQVTLNDMIDFIETDRKLSVITKKQRGKRRRVLRKIFKGRMEAVTFDALHYLVNTTNKHYATEFQIQKDLEALIKQRTIAVAHVDFWGNNGTVPKYVSYPREAAVALKIIKKANKPLSFYALTQRVLDKMPEASILNLWNAVNYLPALRATNKILIHQLDPNSTAYRDEQFHLVKAVLDGGEISSAQQLYFAVKPYPGFRKNYPLEQAELHLQQFQRPFYFKLTHRNWTRKKEEGVKKDLLNAFKALTTDGNYTTLRLLYVWYKNLPGNDWIPFSDFRVLVEADDDLLNHEALTGYGVIEVEKRIDYIVAVLQESNRPLTLRELRNAIVSLYGVRLTYKIIVNKYHSLLSRAERNIKEILEEKIIKKEQIRDERRRIIAQIVKESEEQLTYEAIQRLLLEEYGIAVSPKVVREDMSLIKDMSELGEGEVYREITTDERRKFMIEVLKSADQPMLLTEVRKEIARKYKAKVTLSMLAEDVYKLIFELFTEEEVELIQQKITTREERRKVRNENIRKLMMGSVRGFTVQEIIRSYSVAHGIVFSHHVMLLALRSMKDVELLPEMRVGTNAGVFRLKTKQRIPIKVIQEEISEVKAGSLGMRPETKKRFAVVVKILKRAYENNSYKPVTTAHLLSLLKSWTDSKAYNRPYKNATSSQVTRIIRDPYFVQKYANMVKPSRRSSNGYRMQVTLPRSKESIQLSPRQTRVYVLCLIMKAHWEQTKEKISRRTLRYRLIKWTIPGTETRPYEYVDSIQVSSDTRHPEFKPFYPYLDIDQRKVIKTSQSKKVEGDKIEEINKNGKLDRLIQAVLEIMAKKIERKVKENPKKKKVQKRVEVLGRILKDHHEKTNEKLTRRQLWYAIMKWKDPNETHALTPYSRGVSLQKVTSDTKREEFKPFLKYLAVKGPKNVELSEEQPMVIVTQSHSEDKTFELKVVEEAEISAEPAEVVIQEIKTVRPSVSVYSRAGLGIVPVESRRDKIRLFIDEAIQNRTVVTPVDLLQQLQQRFKVSAYLDEIEDDVFSMGFGRYQYVNMYGRILKRGIQTILKRVPRGEKITRNELLGRLRDEEFNIVISRKRLDTVLKANMRNFSPYDLPKKLLKVSAEREQLLLETLNGFKITNKKLVPSKLAALLRDQYGIQERPLAVQKTVERSKNEMLRDHPNYATLTEVKKQARQIIYQFLTRVGVGNTFDFSNLDSRISNAGLELSKLSVYHMVTQEGLYETEGLNVQGARLAKLISIEPFRQSVSDRIRVLEGGKRGSGDIAAEIPTQVKGASLGLLPQQRIQFETNYGNSLEGVLVIVSATRKIVGIDLSVHFGDIYNQILKSVQQKGGAGLNALVEQVIKSEKIKNLLAFLDQEQPSLVLTEPKSPKAVLLQVKGHTSVIIPYENPEYRKQFEADAKRMIGKGNILAEEVKQRTYFIYLPGIGISRDQAVKNLLSGKKVQFEDKGRLSLARIANDAGIYKVRDRLVWNGSKQLIESVLDKLIMRLGLPLESAQVNSEYQELYDVVEASLASWLSKDPEALVQKGYLTFEQDRYRLTSSFIQDFFADVQALLEVKQLIDTMA